jgi:hypothetical protein
LARRLSVYCWLIARFLPIDNGVAFLFGRQSPVAGFAAGLQDLHEIRHAAAGDE